MKPLKFLSFLTFVLLVSSCKGQDKNKASIANSTTSQIEVFDFHSTHRCVTCNAIETSTRYTLDTYFKNEIKQGTVTFHVINVDKKENAELAEKFEASGTALFLNVVKSGKEKKIDLTNFAFSKGRNQEEFSKELKSIITRELNTL